MSFMGDGRGGGISTVGSTIMQADGGAGTMQVPFLSHAHLSRVHFSGILRPEASCPITYISGKRISQKSLLWKLN